jgi:hypothetical protein
MKAVLFALLLVTACSKTPDDPSRFKRAPSMGGPLECAPERFRGPGTSESPMRPEEKQEVTWI